MEQRDTFKQAFEFAKSQVKSVIENHPDYFPLYTQNGKWKHDGDPWTKWGEGYFGGQIWIFAKETEDSWWREKAEHYSKLIEHRKDDKTSQSMWSLFWPTYKRWYDLSNDPNVKQVALDAGVNLAGRYNPKGKYLASFVAPNSNLIDNMMSVGIIFYAAREMKDDTLMDIAMNHCNTTRRFNIRGDHSIIHESLFNPETGECIGFDTHQGWRPDSSWTRGQAWAIYGFGNAYHFTGEQKYLDTAMAAANYYIERTPDHGIAPNDWDEENRNLVFESSTAAATANGMLRLSKMISNPEQVKKYRDYAFTILSTLCSSEFLANQTPGWEGVIKHGIYHERKKIGIDESMIWGDYFFLEALEMVLFDGF